ncbi:hypothetical protein T439DRAFT_320700 [Meredithblackwellia eburnea MCA 4105]
MASPILPSSPPPAALPPSTAAPTSPPVPARVLTATSEGGANIKTRPSRLSMSSHPLFAARVRGLRLRIMRFTPSWFSVTMGTGIVNTLLFDIPFERVHPAFRGIGAAFLIFDILLFLSFALITILRYALYPAFFFAMLNNETHSLFLGTIPMGFVTITSGIAKTGTEYGITWALDLALVMWWIALVMSILTAFVVPFVMFTRHKNTPEALTAAWLLPVVPPITIGAVGSSLCGLLTERGRYNYSLTILLASYVMTGVGVLIACGIMTNYFQRLVLHHLPPREVIVSTFLPLGPCGQGGFALIELGRNATKLFPLLAASQPDRIGYQELASIGTAMYGSGVVTGLLMWGLGIWWMFLAVVSVASHYVGKTVAFNMGWWAFTFPLGSLNLLTYSLGQTFDSLFFKVVGVMMTFSVTALWTIVFVPTALGFLRGTLFPAPCLASLPPAYVEKLPLGMRGAIAKEAGVGNGDAAAATPASPAPEIGGRSQTS